MDETSKPFHTNAFDKSIGARREVTSPQTINGLDVLDTLDAFHERLMASRKSQAETLSFGS